MTKNFKKYLKEHGISFEEKKKEIIINDGYVDLNSLTSLPEGIPFGHKGVFSGHS